MDVTWFDLLLIRKGEVAIEHEPQAAYTLET